MCYSRKPLYPDLEDHDLVKSYPDVRGFARNVFFLTHENCENDGNEDDSGSKYNTYEVNQIILAVYKVNIRRTGKNDQRHGTVSIKASEVSVFVTPG